MIAVISDTHMPKGKRRLPAQCVETIGAAEALIHAGDFSAVSILEELERLCPVVLGVRGNVDEPLLRQRLPESLEVEVGGRTVAVIHDSGPKQDPLRRPRASFPAAGAVGFGHSQHPLPEQDGGLQVFNSGSPTHRPAASPSKPWCAAASLAPAGPRRSGAAPPAHRWASSTPTPAACASNVCGSGRGTAPAHPPTRRRSMAELTALEEKLAEVLGLAQA